MATITATNSAAKNLQIQWLRAIAALLVLICHASPMVEQVSSYHGILNNITYRFGYFPVALFFAISGNLMASILQRQNAALFLSHRLVRIYPLYLVTILVVCALQLVTNRPLLFDALAPSLLPVDTAVHPLGPVEWTLIFEISFYVALCLVRAVGLSKYISIIAVAWFAVVLIYSLLPSGHAENLNFLLTGRLANLTNVFLFVPDGAMAGGLLLPLLTQLRISPLIFLAAGTGCLSAISGMLTLNEVQYCWLADAAAVLIVAGAISAGKRNPTINDNVISQLIAKLGDYSYALYLCHFPIIVLIYTYIHDLPYSIIFAVCIGCSLTVSVFVGRFDVKLYDVLKKCINGTKPQTRVIFVVLYLAAFFAITGLVAYQRYSLIGAKQYAFDVLPSILANGPIEDNASADAVFTAAGFTKTNRLEGTVDFIHWPGATVHVIGWEINTDPEIIRKKYGEPIALAFFQDGALLGTSNTWDRRPDIEEKYHTKAYAGYQMNVTGVTCRNQKPIVGVAFTASGIYSVLPSITFSCLTGFKRL